MLRARLATAALAIPLIIWIVARGPAWLFATVVSAFALLGVAEYFMMAFPDSSRARPERVLGIGGGGMLIVACAVGQPELIGLVLAAFVASALVLTLLLRTDAKQATANVGQLVLGILYAGFLMPHLIWLRALEGGWRWVFYALAIAMAGDSGAYFGGRYLGKHRLLPRISPAKTVEGAVAGVLCSLLAAAVAKLLILGRHGWQEVMVLGLATAIVAQLGDLCESMLKRAFGAKDSGWLLPGHGGVLDRTDSLVFSVALVYYYLSFS